jgi:hypothetical protein
MNATYYINEYVLKAKGQTIYQKWVVVGNVEGLKSIILLNILDNYKQNVLTCMKRM